MRRRELRWALFIAGMIIFNFPVMSIFNKPHFILGVPMLYFFIFFLWLWVIFFTYLLSSKKN